VPDRLDQGRSTARLADDAVGAGDDAGHDERPSRGACVENDRRPVGQPPNLQGQRQAVASAVVEVEHEHVGPGAAQERPELGVCAGGADQPEVRL
jgi:hypothetical protein